MLVDDLAAELDDHRQTRLWELMTQTGAQVFITAVILNFGGGCQGCSSVKVTLKNGVEAQLKSQYPEINSVLDVTDHSNKENAYM